MEDRIFNLLVDKMQENHDNLKYHITIQFQTLNKRVDDAREDVEELKHEVEKVCEKVESIDRDISFYKRAGVALGGIITSIAAMFGLGK